MRFGLGGGFPQRGRNVVALGDGPNCGDRLFDFQDWQVNDRGDNVAVLAQNGVGLGDLLPGIGECFVGGEADGDESTSWYEPKVSAIFTSTTG